jgi:hypothetical protein
MPGLWIDDGYSIADTLPAMPGVYDAVDFTYRPAMFGQRTKFQSAPTPEAAQKAAAEIVAEHVIDFPGLPAVGVGSGVGPRSKKLATIHPAALNYLLNAVLGYTAPQPAGDSKAEADAKNSA